MENKLTFYHPNGNKELLTIQVIRKTLVSGNGQPSDFDCITYMNKCHAMNLNPFLGDSYLISLGNRAVMVISKGGYLKIANSHPQYDGFSAGVAVMTEDGEIRYRDGSMALPSERLIGGWACVRRKDWSQPLRVEVSMAEYNKGRDQWKSMPATMIRKVAIVHALREAFPDKYHETYAAEEFIDGHSPPKPSGTSIADKMQPASQAINVEAMIQTTDDKPQDIMDDVKEMILEGHIKSIDEVQKYLNVSGAKLGPKRKEQVVDWLAQAMDAQNQKEFEEVLQHSDVKEEIKDEKIEDTEELELTAG